MGELLDLVAKEKIVAIVRGIPGEAGDRTADALLRGGVVFLEVTMNTEGALAMIQRFRERHGGRLRVGAGTVLDVGMAREAAAAGAEYLISPNLDEEVIRFGLQRGMEVWPGTMTPTEIVRAHKLGAGAVKVFPMGALGVGYLKEIRAPLGHIPMIATGGVNLDNIGQFLQAGAIAVGLGGNLVRKDLIAAGEFEQIEQLARAFADKARQAARTA